MLVNGGANVVAAAVTSMSCEVLLAFVVVSVDEDDATTVANTVIGFLLFFDPAEFSSCSSLLDTSASLTRQLKVFPPWLFPRPKPNIFGSGNRIAAVVNIKLHNIVKIQRSGHRVMIYNIILMNTVKTTNNTATNGWYNRSLQLIVAKSLGNR